ncbi:S-layer homology domain-containing protein [Cohnella rhizosphaerae]|uniref:S-layer homology domain-containing protein n=1 Tax=Cohnella rhizosphaerae TaxID=1457232 RepID=A0A9X4QTL2_9BACL|nr:S-layer homology domain-containing protein [Cohnella rhizosphaerae]MDG0810463.1 S-layer homology domain-containing protein [Cohnella rhizosphaerae]
MTNADPSRGFGPVMYSFTLSYEERIPPFAVRANDVLNIQPGETKALELAVTNRDTVAHQAAMSVLPTLKDALSFVPESSSEGDYLIENEGSAISGGGRYADGSNDFVYRIPVPQDLGNPVLKLTLSNRFEMSLSADGTNWNVVDYEADSSVEGSANIRERSYPVGSYASVAEAVYVKIGDRYGQGWGGMLHKLTLSGDSEPELAIAFPDDHIEIQPHQTRTIRVLITPNADIATASPQQPIRLSAGGIGSDYMLPVKINFVKPVYAGHWAAAPISVDGIVDEGEWSDAQDIVINERDPDLLRYGALWGDTGHIDARYRLKWDDTNLYVLEQRQDSEFLFTETGANMFSSTASMLFLDTDHDKSGAAYRSGDYAVLFTAGGPDSQPHAYMRQGDDGGVQEYPLTDAVIQSKVDTAAHAYVLEMAIPWSALRSTSFVPGNDEVAGMSVLSTRKLSGNVWGQLMWMGNGDDQANWADMKLVGKPAPETPVDVTPPTSTSPIDSGSRQTVTAADLKNAQDGIVRIKVLENKESVWLPTDIADLIGSNRLQIEQHHMTVSFSREQLQKIQSAATGAQAAGAQIRFSAALVPNETVATVLQGLNRSSLQVTAAGDVIDFKLDVVAADGSVLPVAAFADPLTLTLKVNPDANARLSGVYEIAADGTAKYAGGDLTDGAMTVKIDHPAAYAVLEYDKTFSDVPSSFWAGEVIKLMAAKHVIEGVSDTRFEPQGIVTRAEFSAMIARALDLKAVNQATFKDVDSTKWYADSVAAVYEAGIVLGRSEDLFAPSDTITREEMAVLAIRAYAYKKGHAGAGASTAPFNDLDQIHSWAQAAVSQARELGLLDGRGNNRFAPKERLTRAEGAQILSELWVALQQ